MRAAACRLHGIFTPHAAARSMLTNHALEQLRADATKPAAHSSEQHHHADHYCAARRWAVHAIVGRTVGPPGQGDYGSFDFPLPPCPDASLLHT